MSQLKIDCSPRFRLISTNGCVRVCSRSSSLWAKLSMNLPDNWIMYSSLPTSIVSLLYTMENGTSAEMGLTGNDGVVGIALFMGGGTMPNRAVVQSAGGALRMKAKVLQDEFALGGKFQQLLLRYTQALITQISQTAVCNRLHSVEQQLCRWLLLSHDRLKTDELVMTQELIADMLGVRREGVTVAAGRLQDAGAISYVRGHIQILDRQRAGRHCLRMLPGGQRRVRSVAGIDEIWLRAISTHASPLCVLTHRPALA